MLAHIPVLLREAVLHLACKPGGVYVDGTLGGAGYAIEILKATSPGGVLVAMDKDEDAVKAAKEKLEPFKDRVILAQGSFKNLQAVLNGASVDGVDGVVFDLGVSSHQFDTPERGFSFRHGARLDMRMDKSSAKTAHVLVNTLTADELERIFKEYGEERFARKVASAIVKARSIKPVDTTLELAGLVADAIPKRFHAKGIHPATKVFQALRIAVNAELDDLKDGIEAAIKALKKGGRLVIISFHSLEDRIVKEGFREMASPCVCPPRFPHCVCGRAPVARIITKKAVTPSEDEIKSNPRARSAKLRAIEKL